MTLHERLIELRLKHNLLQKDLASKIGISLRAYQYYEKAEREPASSVLIALAKFYSVSIDYLVGLTDNPAINR